MHTLHNIARKLDVCQAPRNIKRARNIKNINFLNKNKSKVILALT